MFLLILNSTLTEWWEDIEATFPMLGVWNHNISSQKKHLYVLNGGQGWLDAAEEFQEGRNPSIRTFYSPLHRSEPSPWNDTWSREAGCPRCTRAPARGTPPTPRPRAPSSPHCTRRPHSHFQRQEHLGVKAVHIISFLCFQLTTITSDFAQGLQNST